MQRVQLSRDRAAKALAPLPAILAGRVPDPTGLGAPLRLRLGMIALMFIKADFIAKSAGGPGESTPAWKPLAPSTVRGRRKGAGQGQPEILRDTGRLFNSLSPGGPGSLLRVTAAGVDVGTNVEYAAWVARERPLWPEWPDWPERWRVAVLDALAEGTKAVALALLRIEEARR